MRHYPIDSPEAATRIVALAAVADGHVSLRELETLDNPEANRALGIDPEGVHRVMQALCEDALAAHRSHWSDDCVIDETTIDLLLDEIRSPSLRATVMRLCEEVAATDGHLAEGECVVLARAAARWGLVPTS